MPAQIINPMQAALCRREQNGSVPAHDQNGLAARRHCDIAAHDRKIGSPSSSARDDLGQTLDRDQFETDAFQALGEVERRRRHDRLVIAVARNRDAQNARAFKIIDGRGGSGKATKLAMIVPNMRRRIPILSG